MPFDALAQSDALAELGIVPVTSEALERHKTALLRNYGGYWRTLFPTTEELPAMLRRYNAPGKVRRLAERVSAAHPKATWHLGWHYRDPYLSVRIGDQSQCLAIWLHRFRTIAIAQHPVERRRWWW